MRKPCRAVCRRLRPGQLTVGARDPGRDAAAAGAAPEQPRESAVRRDRRAARVSAGVQRDAADGARAPPGDRRPAPGRHQTQRDRADRAVPSDLSRRRGERPVGLAAGYALSLWVFHQPTGYLAEGVHPFERDCGRSLAAAAGGYRRCLSRPASRSRVCRCSTCTSAAAPVTRSTATVATLATPSGSARSAFCSLPRSWCWSRRPSCSCSRLLGGDPSPGRCSHSRPCWRCHWRSRRRFVRRTLAHSAPCERLDLAAGRARRDAGNDLALARAGRNRCGRLVRRQRRARWLARRPAARDPLVLVELRRRRRRHLGHEPGR